MNLSKILCEAYGKEQSWFEDNVLKVDSPNIDVNTTKEKSEDSSGLRSEEEHEKLLDDLLGFVDKYCPTSPPEDVNTTEEKKEASSEKSVVLSQLSSDSSEKSVVLSQLSSDSSEKSVVLAHLSSKAQK
jgi:hypothetical protein